MPPTLKAEEDREVHPLSDEQFLAAFEAGTLETFRHRDHVRMTWLYLRAHGEEAAEGKVVDGIRRFAAAKEATALFHVTLTRAWLRMVAAAVRRTPEGTFDGFAERHPELLDKGRIYCHYHRETIAGPEAREGWVAPDREPLTPAPARSSQAL